MDAHTGSRWQQVSMGRRLLLIVAVLWHASLHIPWFADFYDRLTFDSVATSGQRAWDFYALYQAGHNALTGASIYESDDDQIDVVVLRHTPYRYLPFAALTLGLAANALPPVTAYWIWVAIIELVLVFCAARSWRLARDANRAALLDTLWLLYSPCYLELYLGQFTLVQAALVLGMLVASEGGLRPRADVWWTLSLLWKQNTALLLPVYLRTKRWLPLLLAALVVLTLSLPYLLAVPGALAAFGRNLIAGPPGHQLGNLGVRQWLFSLFTWLWPGATGAAVWAGRTWTMLVLALCALVTFRPAKVAPGRLICLWLTCFFLIYHDVWEHHYVLALPICVWLYAHSGSRWVLICWALLALWTPYVLIDPQGLAAQQAAMRWLPLGPAWLDVLYHSSKAVPILALWGWQLTQLRRREAPCSPACATT